MVILGHLIYKYINLLKSSFIKQDKILKMFLSSLLHIYTIFFGILNSVFIPAFTMTNIINQLGLSGIIPIGLLIFVVLWFICLILIGYNLYNRSTSIKKKTGVI